MKKIIINKDLKIIQAMKKLASTGLRCLIVSNKKKKLLGTLTDGDIRRAILKGKKLNESIKNIYNRNPNFLKKNNFSLNSAKSLLASKSHILLPVVDSSSMIVDYLNWEKVFGKETNEQKLSDVSVVIMAGGKGSRLKPFTEFLPKPLIPVGNKPIIEHIIEKFNSFGVKNFFISTKYKSRILKSYLKDLKSSYSTFFLSEDKPLGTVGGLYKHKKKFNSTFFLTNCDIIVNVNLNDVFEFHKKNKNDLTLVVSTKSYEVPYGVCQLDKKGKFQSISEKPKNFYLANTGLYVLEPKILKYLPKNQFYHMTDLIKSMKKLKRKVGVFPIDESLWLDIGQWPEYNKNSKKI